MSFFYLVFIYIRIHGQLVILTDVVFLLTLKQVAAHVG